MDVTARSAPGDAAPGPAPACSDAELLTIALVRHLLGRRSEARFLAEVARGWGHLFPRLPRQSQANRRIRWLWGASGQFRAHLADLLPVDDCQQVDTSALPVNGASCPQPSTSATWPPACWRPGRRRATCFDKGFSGAAFAASQAARGIVVLVPPTKDQRRQMPGILQKIIAEWRNGSRPPSRRSPARWIWPATERTSSGDCSPAPPRPLPLTPCCGFTWPGSSRHRSPHVTRLRR
jgi:hypothetical protein